MLPKCATTYRQAIPLPINLYHSICPSEKYPEKSNVIRLFKSPAVLVSDTRKHQDSDVVARGIRTIFGGTDVIFIFNSEKYLFRLIQFQ